MTQDIQIPKMLTIKQASAASGLTEYRLRELCKHRKIVCILCGNKYLINLDRLIDYLNRGDNE